MSELYQLNSELLPLSHNHFQLFQGFEISHYKTIDVFITEILTVTLSIKFTTNFI